MPVKDGNRFEYPYFFKSNFIKKQKYDLKPRIIANHLRASPGRALKNIIHLRVNRNRLKNFYLHYAPSHQITTGQLMVRRRKNYYNQILPNVFSALFRALRNISDCEKNHNFARHSFTLRKFIRLLSGVFPTVQKRRIP